MVLEMALWLATVMGLLWVTELEAGKEQLKELERDSL